MRIILSSRAKRFCCILLGVFLLVILLINIIGSLLNCKYISVFAAIEEVNTYEVRSELLMEAMSAVGVCSPEEAVEVWASGLKLRSAALQYAVMSKELKDEYAKQLDESAPNWATGISSPWVDSYKIVSAQKQSAEICVFELEFSLATSTGPAGDYSATLTVKKEGDFFRIVKIKAPEALYPYTRFKV